MGELSFFAISLINAIIVHCKGGSETLDSSSMKLAMDLICEKAKKDDYVFLLLLRASILPMSRYISSKLECMNFHGVCISSIPVNLYIGI